jgi:hypothetical protein
VEPPPALTALPTPKLADRAELKQLRKQLTERRPSMIYELQTGRRGATRPTRHRMMLFCRAFY